MDKETKTKLIVVGVVLALVAGVVIWGRYYFGPEQFAVVCGLIGAAFVLGGLLGAYLGATKSKSLTRRIERDN